MHLIFYDRVHLSCHTAAAGGYGLTCDRSTRIAAVTLPGTWYHFIVVAVHGRDPTENQCIRVELCGFVALTVVLMIMMSSTTANFVEKR